ncbi:GntR family transcriptional regulator [Roseivivax sediminis]|uniref:DNA-binding transcriptional regulator, GntR family n=1 Tax=Roseivivax sediminis TaxID=936889 RepID=A0A1I1UGW6_9RHOB|nr:GntR family transcriptional regulator [Roseivivax sediminis]SFD69845.1 DNA-binding transcriptional regulator, GntR family [Roseivivax sediminis]
MSAEARHQRLYSELRGRICLLDYPPGTKLGEESLASEFGVSRTPVRRVLARLADEGLVEARHGVGTLVTDVDARELGEVYALREELAQLSGTMTPRPVTQSVLDEARGLVAEGERLAEAPDARAFARLNMAYFDFTQRLIGNEALAEVSERLYFRTARIWLKTISALDLGREIEAFREEMRQVAGALASGDMTAVGMIRRAHISMSFHRLKAALPGSRPAN